MKETYNAERDNTIKILRKEQHTKIFKIFCIKNVHRFLNSTKLMWKFCIDKDDLKMICFTGLMHNQSLQTPSKTSLFQLTGNRAVFNSNSQWWKTNQHHFSTISFPGENTLSIILTWETQSCGQSWSLSSGGWKQWKTESGETDWPERNNRRNSTAKHSLS